jgi:hypothetical protein
MSASLKTINSHDDTANNAATNNIEKSFMRVTNKTKNLLSEPPNGASEFSHENSLAANRVTSSNWQIAILAPPHQAIGSQRFLPHNLFVRSGFHPKTVSHA